MQEHQRQANAAQASQTTAPTQQAKNDTQELPVNFPQGSADQLPTLAEWNNRYIDYVLNYTKGKKTAAARILGINRRTLYRRNKSKSADIGDESLVESDSTH